MMVAAAVAGLVRLVLAAAAAGGGGGGGNLPFLQFSAGMEMQEDRELTFFLLSKSGEGEGDRSA